MKPQLEDLGEVYNFENFTIFFGNKTAQPEELKNALSGKQLFVLKQTHSAQLHEAQPSLEMQISENTAAGNISNTEGDALWTAEKNKVLVVKSADCLPVLVASPAKGIALAIHAGWRGVAQQIIEKSIRALDLHSDPGLHVWIGPHIQRQSFEVGADVAQEILTPYGMPADSKEAAAFIDRKGDKYLLNLSGIVEDSLIKLGLESRRIFISPTDTRTSENHYSYRRGEQGVRNYSFIFS